MAERRADLLLAAAILGVLSVSVFATLQGESVEVGGKALGSTCWMQAWLGVLCPFCGMTRSFIALGHGDLTLSLAYHPGGVLMFSMAVAVLGTIVWNTVRRAKPLSSHRLLMPAVQIVSLTCVGIGVVRTLVS